MRTELVFIVDRSGSMAGLEKDTIGGFNSMISKQQGEEGLANVTTVLFDDRVEMLHDRVPVQKMEPLTEKEYYVRGMTALLDAIGGTINHMGNVQKYRKPEERAEKVLVIITTDGHENASREFSHKKIRSMIQHQKETYGWEFLFIGANIDAIDTASHFGIDEEYATNYIADEVGTDLNYDAMNEAITSVRSNKKLDRSWKEKIERDYHRRI